MMKTKQHTQWKFRLVTWMIPVILVFVALSLIACQPKGSALDEVVVENYREDFFVGDSFETGAEFKAYAVYDDGNRVDVTDKVTVTPEKALDMNTAGDYMITVEYEGKKCVYSIYVSTSDVELRKIELDTSAAKLSYLLGDTISYEGLRIVATYENEQGRMIERSSSNIRDFKVTLTDPLGAEVTAAFSEMGKHTVTVALESFTATYDVTVEGVNLSTVLSALNVGSYGMRNVNGAQIDMTSTVSGSSTTHYDVVYGNNYTYYKEEMVEDSPLKHCYENHYSINSKTGNIDAVCLVDGEVTPVSALLPEYMNGIPYHLWYLSTTEYGICAAIRNVYTIGSQNPNQDFVESADPDARKYSFSFGYLQSRVNGVPYYFVTSVEFSIGENYAITSAQLTQKLYTTDHTTDVAGHTTITCDPGKFDYCVDVKLTHSIGERTAVNPYAEGSTLATDFDLIYNNEVLEDGAVIKGNVGADLTLKIGNIVPETAVLATDSITYSDGISTPDAVIFVGRGFNVYRRDASPDILRIHLSAGGDWDLIVKSTNVTRRIKLSITGVAPESLTTEVYNPNFQSFSKGTEVTPMIGSTVYFRAVPNQYANGAYNAVMTSGSTNGVSLEETEVNGTKCWKFTAEKPGRYVVKMTSTVAKDVSCILTFNVVDAPKFSEMLKGSYQVTDTEGNRYDLTFVQTSANETSVVGTVEVTFKPKSGDAKTQKMNFSTSDNDLTLVLETVSGEELGIALKVNSEGKFVLEDRYSVNYVLTR